jgi:hypothetical protein
MAIINIPIQIGFSTQTMANSYKRNVGKDPWETVSTQAKGYPYT